MSSANGTPWLEEDPTPKSKSDALRALGEGLDIAGTPAEKYLRDDRRIDMPHPPELKFWQNARTGEGALLAPLQVKGNVVGIQAVYIDRDGHKSTVDPPKQRLSLERAPGAAFYLPYDGDSTDLLIAEGLEDALTVWRYGAVRCRVIGLPGIGALKHLRFPESTKVTVVADGDPPGSKGTELLRKGLDALILRGCEVTVTVTPPEGWDANRILVEHGADTLKRFLESARPAELSDNGKIRKLAKLDLLAYGRVRKQVAEELDITLGILDKLVENERKKIAEEAKAAEDDWVGVDDTRPWSEEVDGAELLDDLARTVASFVIMSSEAAWAIALWIVFTWCFEAAHSALKLWIKSAEKRSGKTRLLEVLSYLVKQPLVASGMTVAAFFRLIEMKRPTILLDEFDTFAAEDENFRGVLNAGFDKRNSVKYICIGDDKEPTPFSLWTPQVIAGIGNIADTVADRSIKIELDRKLRSQKVEKLRRRGTGALEELAQKCARWAVDNLGDLANAEPEVPESINDRAADGWELLIAIADQAGGHWQQQARQAAIKLSGDGDYSLDDESISIWLLHDIRAVLDEHPPTGGTPAARDKIRSADLVKWLVALEDRPWVEFKRGQPMTQYQLSTQLRKFHIRSGSKRAGEPTFKGYSRAALERVIDRYLPPLHPNPDPPPSSGKPNGHDDTFSSEEPFFRNQVRHTVTSGGFCGSQPDSSPSHESRCDGLENPRNPSKTAICDGVTDLSPKNSPSGGKDASNRLADDDDRDDDARDRHDDGNPIADAALADDRPDTPDPTSIADEAKRLKKENPSWAAKRIASELGQSEARIARYLAQ